MSSEPALPIGDLAIYDDYLPSLPGGRYRMTVTHQVDVAGASIPDHVRDFAVLAPRYAIDPNDVHTIYPPDGSSGHFSHNLPHVVLSRRMLPWERRIGDAATAPWTGLLVLEASEIKRQFASMTVDELLGADDGVMKPALEPAAGEGAQTCRIVDIAGDLFLQIAPRLAELPLLAHCRQANTGDKAAASLAEDGWFSVVVANRFPRGAAANEPAGVLHVAHLVSLEGWDQVLNGAAPIARRADGTVKDVRLVSLATWSFRCLPDLTETFAGLAGNLARQSSTTDTLLRLPVKVADAGVARRLAAGYAPLAYKTATGEETIAWYRGPLSPAAPTRLPDGVNATAAPGIYVPTDGMFDQSFAAAWRLGRSLAIADQGFVGSLMDMRTNGRRLLDRLLALRELGMALPATLAEVQAANPAVDRMVRQLTGGLVQHVDAMAKTGPVGGTPAPLPPPVNPLTALLALLADPAATALLAEQAGLDAPPVAQWLVALRLLNGAPFSYLVPSPDMLPNESIRFFMVDPAWLEMLVDGALSVAAGTSIDGKLMAIARQAIDTAVRTGLDAAAGGASTVSAPIGGLLLRSVLVAGWPGLAVRPSAGGRPLPILRMVLLSGTVLLCLTLGIADRVELSEPQEALRFGVDDDGSCVLRNLNGDATGAAIPSAADPNIPARLAAVPGDFADGASLRDGGHHVLDVGGLAERLRGAVGAPAALRPSEFALLMIQAPERVVFLKSRGGGG